MAHLDEGVRSLERFIGLLALATGEVERTARDLANADRDLSALERAAAEQGTGFNERLQDLGAAIESGADQATEALEDLKAMAEAPEPIDDARDRLGEAVGEITQRARAAGEDADESHALVEEGFANLGRTTDELARQLTRADEEMDSRTAELAETVAAFQGRTEAAWDAPAL
ncbi:MAG TPA: hypothetical protein VFO85_00070, partial [Vicinamibacteria bacterium]|nr:hypothetical protein [Vicinamibacteria bacterium]